jgi:hypothetical protein
MSDFLSSLLARSFGTAPVIRPRVTSLFEPVRGGAGLAETLTSRNEETIEEPAEETVAGEPKREKSARPSRALADGVEQEEASTAGHVKASSIPQHSAQPLRETEHNTITERLIEKRETRILLGEQHSDTSPKPTLSTGNQERSGNPKKSSMPETTSLPTHVQTFEKEKPGQLMPPKITPEMRIPDLALKTKPERRGKEENSVLRKEFQTSEPTVQVTIGRIEVRANKESTISTRPASGSPVVSLDEYLRKRAQRVEP